MLTIHLLGRKVYSLRNLVTKMQGLIVDMAAELLVFKKMINATQPFLGEWQNSSIDCSSSNSSNADLEHPYQNLIDVDESPPLVLRTSSPLEEVLELSPYVSVAFDVDYPESTQNIPPAGPDQLLEYFKSTGREFHSEMTLSGNENIEEEFVKKLEKNEEEEIVEQVVSQMIQQISAEEKVFFG